MNTPKGPNRRNGIETQGQGSLLPGAVYLAQLVHESVVDRLLWSGHLTLNIACLSNRGIVVNLGAWLEDMSSKVQ